MGKTSFALYMAAHAAITEKIPVAILGLETSREQLAMRLLSAESKVDSQRLRDVVAVGDAANVRTLNADAERGRIALSTRS